MIPMRPLKRESALRYGVYYASRLLPHPFLKGAAAAFIRTGITLLHGSAAASNDVETQAPLRRLREEGLASVCGPLSTTQIDEVLSFLATEPVAQGASGQPVTAASQGVSSAAYDLPTILACPHLLKAINHPGLLEIAAGFLGCKPTISGVGLRWSFPHGAAASGVQKFHRDTEDWKILRLFIYLTDVSDDSGPHQYVTRSHKAAGRFRQSPYTDSDIDREFGRDKVATVSGPRGTAFMGDMWGVHRGLPPMERARLLFNCTYTMTATPIYRYSPVQVPDKHLYDSYTNRLLIC